MRDMPKMIACRSTGLASVVERDESPRKKIRRDETLYLSKEKKQAVINSMSNTPLKFPDVVEVKPYVGFEHRERYVSLSRGEWIDNHAHQYVGDVGMQSYPPPDWYKAPEPDLKVRVEEPVKKKIAFGYPGSRCPWSIGNQPVQPRFQTGKIPAMVPASVNYTPQERLSEHRGGQRQVITGTFRFNPTAATFSMPPANNAQSHPDMAQRVAIAKSEWEHYMCSWK